jgi:sugar lactone lactonase YvrE
MGLEQVTGPEVYHGEGPAWYPGWGGLRFVDSMLAGDIISLAADGSLERRHVGSIAAAVRPRRGGGAVIGVERGFALEDPDWTLTVLTELWRDPGVRMNEGCCDPDGRFYCGSMAYDQSVGAASLYRLDPEGSVEMVLNQVMVSNGLEWSPDGSRVYDNDTATFTISVFDYDTAGGLTNRRTFAELPDGSSSRTD